MSLKNFKNSSAERYRTKKKRVNFSELVQASKKIVNSGKPDYNELKSEFTIWKQKEKAINETANSFL